MAKKKILVICQHNSARSQMAEGFLNSSYGHRFEASSAGIEPSSLNPYAIRVMSEIGIDISNHRSKSIREFLGTNFDYVVTLCDEAKEMCPFFPGGGEYIHKSFQDPETCQGSDEDKIVCFRSIRDEIKKWIEETFGKR